MQINDLIDRVEQLDGGADLARDLRKFVNGRKLGLVYEESKPEYVRLYNKQVVEGDLVNVLPPRGVMEDMTGEDEADVIWRVVAIEGERAALVRLSDDEAGEASLGDLVVVARFDQPIYCGLQETGCVERGGADRPYHTVINGENFHALELLLFPYQGKVDCIYIDPPYNTGARDWKYNNDYVSGEDAYRHSKWLTFMEDRLRLAKKLLNPENSVLICTIDEKEYLRLGLLLEQMFPEATIQMVSSIVSRKGSNRRNEFSRCVEYLFFVMVGDAVPASYISDMNGTGSVAASEDPVCWQYLKRRGTSRGASRVGRPGLFYPIFINRADGSFHSVGKPLPPDQDRHLVIAPSGTWAAFPLRPNGDEGCWQVKPARFLEQWNEGTCYLSSADELKESAQFLYLKDADRRKVLDGAVEIVGKEPGGKPILKSDCDVTVRPKDVWSVESHDATQGTNLLNSFFGSKRFTYPKSLYAVEDALRFFVSDKPDALVVDFFAGSGTTAHAVMRLNRQDGGHRRSISVTNNEVSFEEAKAFTEQGLRQGDEEWEAHGIARYVTIPRVTAAITGLTPEGEPIRGDYKFTDEFPMAEGFKENAVFYDLTYLEPSVVRANLAFDEIAPLLWMRAGSVGPVITLGEADPLDATYEVTDAYGVLFDYTCAAPFIRECRERGVGHVFVVTDVDFEYREMCAEFRGEDVVQLYKSYLRSFEIGQDR